MNIRSLSSLYLYSPNQYAPSGKVRVHSFHHIHCSDQCLMLNMIKAATVWPTNSNQILVQCASSSMVLHSFQFSEAWELKCVDPITQTTQKMRNSVKDDMGQNNTHSNEWSQLSTINLSKSTQNQMRMMTLG